MGKKYIVEIGRLERLYKAYNNGNGMPNMTWLSPEVDLTPYTEPDLEQVRKEAYADGYKTAKIQCGIQAEKDMREVGQRHYQRGLSDAWKAVRKIIHMPEGDLLNIFTECYSAVCTALQVILKYDAPEAIEKIRQYEQEKEEQIQVGDEVVPRETEYDDMIVTRLWKDDYDSDCIDAIGFDGRIGSFLVSRVSKTGKHYEIAEVLKKMKESE